MGGQLGSGEQRRQTAGWSPTDGTATPDVKDRSQSPSAAARTITIDNNGTLDIAQQFHH